MQRITFFTKDDQGQIIMARLSEFEIEGAEEKDGAVEIYVSDEVMQEKAFQEEIDFLQSAWKIEISKKKLKEENWNAKWEASYQPITIADKVRIRASFHQPDDQFKYEILIDPKMSFGTGHHPTTTLVMRQMIEHNFEDKEVLDMGCGTGVLAILAAKMGAKHVDAIDIDPWSFENAQQNAKLNGINNMTVMQGGEDAIPDKKYDAILANINREIVIGQLPIYRSHLKKDGLLLTSGFLKKDERRMVEKAQESGFEKTNQLQNADWLLLEFKAKSE